MSINQNLNFKYCTWVYTVKLCHLTQGRKGHVTGLIPIVYVAATEEQIPKNAILWSGER